METLNYLHYVSYILQEKIKEVIGGPHEILSCSWLKIDILQNGDINSLTAKMKFHIIFVYRLCIYYYM